GPSVVAAFTSALIVAGILHYLTTHERSGVAAKRLVAGGAVVALAIWGTTYLRKHDEHGHVPEDTYSRLAAALKSDNDTQVIQALDHIMEMKEQDKHFVGPVIDVVKRTRSDSVLDHAAEALSRLGSPEALPVLKEAAARDLDDEMKVHLGRAILDLRDPAGFGILIQVLDSGPKDFVRKEALQLIEERTSLKLEGAALKKWWTE